MAVDPHYILLEAESFDRFGGWVLDAQHMDQMGSPYLLAHGCGHPVDDANTRLHLPSGGRWRLWVRTRDWCAPAPGHPGRFAVLLDGRDTGVAFGTAGTEWAWQDGGVHELPQEPAVALRDATGFDGRCDALCFADPSAPPPPADTAWRRRQLGLAPEVDEEVSADLVVVGAGIAGICAALAAAREGLRVVLVQDRPVVGGNSSPEVRVFLNSDRNLDPFPRLGDVVAELEGNGPEEVVEPERGDRFEAWNRQRLELIRSERTLELHAEHRVQAVEREGERIRTVIATCVRSGRRRRIAAPLFVDASGDGNLGVLAGAAYRVGREGRRQTGEALAPAQADRQVLGATLHWYSEETEAASRFPDCPWALPIVEATCQYACRGAWNWEAGFRRDMVADAEGIRDHLLRAIYGNWAYQVNHSERRADYAQQGLAWVGHVLGKRESRRLLGDLVFSQHDLEAEAGAYRDECVPCRWGIDMHLPQPELEALLGELCFRSIAEHPSRDRHPVRSLPYRCLYSRNVDNLFMAGRCVSMTHIAHAYFRNQRTTGMMGEVVGMAAAFALTQGCTPRDVGARHWSVFRKLLQRGVGRPAPVPPQD